MEGSKVNAPLGTNKRPPIGTALPLLALTGSQCQRGSCNGSHKKNIAPTQVATDLTKLATRPTKVTTASTKKNIAPTKSATPSTQVATAPTKKNIAPTQPATTPTQVTTALTQLATALTQRAEAPIPPQPVPAQSLTGQAELTPKRGKSSSTTNRLN